MERSQRRSFTDDYKRQAVDLVASSGRSIGSVAKELGLRDSVLRGHREDKKSRSSLRLFPTSLDITSDHGRRRGRYRLPRRERGYPHRHLDRSRNIPDALCSSRAVRNRNCRNRVE
jgi:transposase-like protein